MRARNVFRIGLELPVLNDMRKQLGKHQKSSVRNIFMKTLDNIFLSIYYMTDHPMWLHSIGVLKFKDKTFERLDFVNNFACMISVIFDVIVTLTEMKRLSNRLKEVKCKADA